MANAATSFSTNTEIFQTNTTTRAGSLLLPSTIALPGRLVTIKDIAGTYPLNNLTFSTISTNFLEFGTSNQILRERYGFINLAAGQNNTWYSIGGSQLTMVTASTINVSSLFTSVVSSGTISMSTLNLVDQVTLATSNAIYQSNSFLLFDDQILSGSLNASGSLILALRAFTPLNISGSALWLDAADTATVIRPGGTNVTQWNDKSGNGRNGTATGTIPFTGNINNITTPAWSGAANTYFGGNVSITGNVLTAFSVFTMNSSSLNSTRILSLGVNGVFDFNNTSYIAALLRFSGGFGSYRNSAPLSLATATQNVPTLLTSVVTGSSNFVFLNGTGATPVATSGNFGIVNYLIAGALGETGTQLLNGTIGEVLLYNVALTTSQRQQIEGYLAWKWGLQGSLPLTHPYYYGPP